MANTITCIRIVCSIVLFCCRTFSFPFYSLYIVAGVSDMLDGFVARRTGTYSEFGSKLDTVADVIMVLVCFIKFFPILNIEVWMYIWIGIIATIKMINAILGYILQKELIPIHSFMNKITGAVLFLFPLSFKWIELRYSVFVACIIATAAAIQEGYYIRIRGKQYGKLDSRTTK